MAHEMNTKVISIYKHTKNQSKRSKKNPNDSKPKSVGAQLHPNKTLMTHILVPKLSNAQNEQIQTATKTPKVHVDKPFGRALGVSETCRKWAQQDAILGDVEIEHV